MPRDPSDDRRLRLELEARVARYLDALDGAVEGGEPDLKRFTEGLSESACISLMELLEATMKLRVDLESSRDFARPAQALATRARGQTIGGRYRLAGELGHGGFGSVWRAWDKHLERPVAIKFVKLDYADGDGADARRFQTEVQALVRTGCIGIQIFDVGTHDGEAFLVLELVEGRPLKSVLEDVRSRGFAGAAPSTTDLRVAIRHTQRPGDTDLIADHDWFRSSARICIAILRAIESIHTAGIRHRDIKPSNVLLRGGGIPVLVDFGLAARCDLRTQHADRETLSGSLPYMAPEQLQRGCTGLDGRTDVYQVGLLLYEFLTLQRAFGTDGTDQAIDKIIRNDYPPPRSVCPAIPRDLERICMRAMAASPEARYQSATSFRLDLERWLQGKVTPIALRGRDLYSLLFRTIYHLRRHERLMLVTFGAVLGATILALFVTLSN